MAEPCGRSPAHDKGSALWAPTFGVVLCIGLVLTGCSNTPKRTYTLPHELCGVPVKKVEPLFPPGSTLKVSRTRYPRGTPHRGCNYLVDGTTAVVMDLKRYDEDLTASERLYEEIDRRPDYVDAHDRVAVLGTRVLAVAPCREGRSDKGEQATGEYAVMFDAPRRSTSAIRDMASAYTSRAAGVDGCD